jgi:hypothetical protein
VTDVGFEAKVGLGEGLFPSELLVLASWVVDPGTAGGWEVLAEGVTMGYWRVDVLRLWFL